jgi:hypothetical protein
MVVSLFDPREKTRNPLYGRLGGLQIGPGRFGRDKNILPLVGFKPIICHLVA